MLAKKKALEEKRMSESTPRSKEIREKKIATRKRNLEERSKKAGFYVHGHKNLGDVYEA